MDEAPISDTDCDYRAFSVEIAQWLFDGSGGHPADTQEFLAAAALIAHFITDGEGVSIQCGEDAVKFVRGLQ